MMEQRPCLGTRIQKIFPQAKYSTHCRNHCINLVIVNSCQNVPEIRNFMDSFNEITYFISYSAKRKTILVLDDRTFDVDDHETELFRSECRRQGLPTLSDTRWMSRVDSISTLLTQYHSIYLCLESISERSTGSSKHDAAAYMK